MGSSNLNVLETSLKNGLKVLIKEVHSAPVVACYIWYRVGSRNERPGITGISHWVEHMLFKGTKKFPKEEIKRIIERNGGRWNGFTGFDYTAYFEVLPSDKLELGLEIESDRMCNSLFDSGEVELERTVIISEREGAENSPEYLLWEEILSTAYRAHPYRWGVIGWKSDLRAITRDDLYSYYRNYYLPNHATVVLVGDLNSDKVLPVVESYFGHIESGGPLPDIRTSEPSQYGERRVKISKMGNATYLGIAYHVPNFGHDDIYPLELLR
jgi:zinc protease